MRNTACALLAYLVVTIALPSFANAVTVPRELTEQANNGDANAMYEIASLYLKEAFSPDGFSRRDEHFASAINWLKPAAEMGHSYAIMGLADAYFFGHGVQRNGKEGERLLLQLAKRKNSNAMTLLASHYASGFDGAIYLQRARKHLDMAVAAGVDSKDEFFKHVEDRIENFNKAYAGAMKGITKDMNQLAVYYSFAGNSQEASKWLSQSAEKGDKLGQWMLADQYRSGSGVPKDDVLAYMWANIAEAHGKPGDVSRRDEYARSLTKEQIAEAQRLSRNWKPKR